LRSWRSFAAKKIFAKRDAAATKEFRAKAAKAAKAKEQNP
jgi:hypothetical protein